MCPKNSIHTTGQSPRAPRARGRASGKQHESWPDGGNGACACGDLARKREVKGTSLPPSPREPQQSNHVTTDVWPTPARDLALCRSNSLHSCSESYSEEEAEHRSQQGTLRIRQWVQSRAHMSHRGHVGLLSGSGRGWSWRQDHPKSHRSVTAPNSWQVSVWPLVISCSAEDILHKCMSNPVFDSGQRTAEKGHQHNLGPLKEFLSPLEKTGERQLTHPVSLPVQALWNSQHSACTMAPTFLAWCSLSSHCIWGQRHFCEPCQGGWAVCLCDRGSSALL